MSTENRGNESGETGMEGVRSDEGEGTGENKKDSPSLGGPLWCAA